jgi:hypothetical protein
MWVSANRASRILYNFLVSIDKNIVFLVPANVCPIVLATFIKADIKFQLVDIDRDTLCIDLQSVNSILADDKRLFGLIFVRTFGYTEFNIGKLIELKKAHANLSVVIDDRCLSVPELEPGQFSDVIDMTLFSTGYSKFVELGYGGFAWLSTANSLVYKCPDILFDEASHETLVADFNEAIRHRKRFHYSCDDWLDNKALPISFDEYKAAIKEERTRSLSHKLRINAIYRDVIPADLWLGQAFDMWRFSVLVDNKTEVLDAIFARGDFASSHYASLAGIFNDERAPVAEQVHSQLVNLFNDDRCDVDMAERVAKVVKEKARK